MADRRTNPHGFLIARFLPSAQLLDLAPQRCHDFSHGTVMSLAQRGTLAPGPELHRMGLHPIALQLRRPMYVLF
ncbi:hypothetical protein DYQ48_21955 [Xanthomonas hortorum]|nr:hypothetical protein BJD10_03250 [Xanthomonas hortorum pv. gardneri]EGD20138.1 hypothetical protein XGA_1178 [Xanthomonas hortorum ATCC 19865]QEW17225.1 hypothetical protein DYQ48_21955 [Xanthomonas hortorum]APP83044.1 hypothetical protein BI317_01465 [Xanthomonas hortorum pv. gardneri]KLA99071.1 hypothetical protein SM17710_10630 [Xanthomonas hortorum pv. gardneri]